MPLFSLLNPHLLFGAVLFAVSTFLDKTYNLPIADLIIPLYSLWLMLRQGSRAATHTMPGVVLAVLLLVWVTISNISHSVPLDYQLRRILSIATLFIPLYAFMWSRDKAPLLAMMLGMMLGFTLYFCGSTLHTMATQLDARALRWIQPTPVILLAVPFILRHQASFALRALFIVAGVVSVLVSFWIEARGPIVSLPVALILFAGAMFLPMPRLFYAAALTAALTLHFATGLYTNAVNQVITSNHMTISNMERAAAIDYSLATANQHPWLGISQLTYIQDFPRYFASLPFVQTTVEMVETPHNTFLEYAVFYGYPAALLMLLAMVRLLWHPTRHALTARHFGTALIVADIIRLSAFYGISGIYRPEWFMGILLLYWLNHHLSTTPTASQPTSSTTGV